MARRYATWNITINSTTFPLLEFLWRSLRLRRLGIRLSIIGHPRLFDKDDLFRIRAACFPHWFKVVQAGLKSVVPFGPIYTAYGKFTTLFAH
jgi:hypothetical protein